MLGQGLALCLSAVLTLSPTSQVQSPRPLHQRSTPNESILVWHREASSYRVVGELPFVSRVRALLTSTLRNPALDLTNAEFVRRTLADQFGARMTETVAPARYVWVLIEGRWVYWCFVDTEFELDFGRWGHVVVETQDEMPVD